MSHRRISATLVTGVLVASSLLIGLPVLLAAPASAADIPVTSGDDDGPDTLRQAVAAANALSGDDLIVIDPSVGTISLASPLTITDGVAIQGNGTTVTRTDSFDMVVIDLATPGAVELDSLNFQPEADTIGRAVFATSATPDSLTITDSTFTGFNSNGGYIYYTSTTEPGGAVRLEAGDLHVSGSTFDSNSSYAEGGAISVGTITGDSSIMRSTFSNNFTIALNNTGGAGLAVGTINPDATLTVAQSYFVGNGSTATRRTGFRGIGMHVTTVQGSLVVDSSTFDHQYLELPDTAPGPMSGWSVGIGRVAAGGSARIVNSTFDEPAIGDVNLTIYVVAVGTVEADASLTLEHSTSVGDGTLSIDDNRGTSVVRNTIADGIDAPNAIVARAGAPIPVQYSLLSSPFNPAYVTDVAGNQFDVPDMKLQPLAYNGGPTPTMMIGPVGPGVGTGMPVALPGEPTLEQRGTGYLRRSGLLDIGAVELPGELPTLPFDDPPTPATPALAATGSVLPAAALPLGVGVLLLGGLLLLGGQVRRAASSASSVTGRRHTKSSQR